MLENPFDDGCFIIANLILIFSSKVKSIFMGIAFGTWVKIFYGIDIIYPRGFLLYFLYNSRNQNHSLYSNQGSNLNFDLLYLGNTSYHPVLPQVPLGAQGKAKKGRILSILAYLYAK